MPSTRGSNEDSQSPVATSSWSASTLTIASSTEPLSSALSDATHGELQRSSLDHMPIAPTLAVAGSFTAPEAQASPVSTEETGQRITRLQQGIRKPKVYTDGMVRNGNLAVTTKPNTLHEALANENWKHAMDHEYSALMRNQTWHLVPPSKGKDIIDCKWVYKVKKKSDGSTDRYKA